jgi:hypothetical protein
MSGEGLVTIQEMEAAGYPQNKIDEYKKNTMSEMQFAGMHEDKILSYFGLEEPKTSIVKEYWNSVLSSFKEPIKQVQKFDVTSPEVTEPQKKMDQILADYQADKIDKVKFESLMNEQNEILQNLEKETQTEVLGITADDIISIPGKIKEGAVGEEFEVAKYWKRGFSQSIYNLALQYHTDGELPQSFFEKEFADTGHIERAIQSFGTIIPDLPVYFLGAAPTALLTRQPALAAASAGFTAGTIRTMYTEALIRGDVDTFSEWWDIFIKEGMKAGGKEALLLGSAAFASGFGNNPITSFMAMYTAFVGVGAALEQKMPTKDELINTALVLGGLQFSGGAITKTTQLIAKTPHKAPIDIVEETIIDPKVREVVVSKNLEIDPKPVEIKKTKPIETKEKITEKIEVLEKELKTLETKKPKEIETKEVEIKNNERIIEVKNEIVKEKEKLEIVEKETKEVEIKKIEIKETTDPIEKVKNLISFETVKEKQTFTDHKNEMVRMFVDRLHPVFRAVKEADKKKVNLDKLNPYEQFSIQPGMVGRASHFIEYGTLNFSNLSAKGKSFNEITSSIKNKKSYEELAAYIVSKRFLEKIKQGWETKLPKKDHQQVVNTLKNKYEKISKELNEYQTSLLDYMLESGMINKKTYDLFLELNKDYVPFFRVTDSISKETNIGKVISNPFKKMVNLKSDKLIIDPFESIYKNTYHFINLAERNNAFVQFIKMVELNKDKFPEISKVEKKAKPIKITKKELENIVENVSKLDKEVMEGFTIFRKDGNIISDTQIGFFRDGKFEVWEVGKELAASLKDMDSTQSSWVNKVFGFPARALRAGATLSPEFMARNPLRDTLFAGITSKYDVTPLLVTFQGIFHLVAGKVAGGKMYKKWVKSGGVQSMLVSFDRNYFAKNVRNEIINTKAHNLIKNPMELLQVMSATLETSTRLGVFAKAYKKSLQRGLLEKDAIERAGFEGRRSTVDFLKYGTKMQSINRYSAFFNARIQGFATIVDAFKTRPGTTGYRIAKYIVAPSILSWVLFNDDERYKALPRWQKDLHWIFFTNDDENAIPWRIPKPFEPGILFGTGVERLLDFIKSEDPDRAKKFGWDLLKSNAKMMLPIPNWTVPFIENFSNKSLFTNRPIVARDQEGLLPEYQWTEYTSETAKLLGRGLRYILGDQTSWSSPSRIDAIIQNWTGGLGKHLVDQADKALIASGVVPDPIKPTDTLADMPIIKAFIVRNPSAGSEHIEDFYKNYLPIKKRLDSIDKLKDPDEALRQLDILINDIGVEHTILVGTADALSKQRQFINIITESKFYNPDEKRQMIDDTYRMMIMIAKDANELISK